MQMSVDAMPRIKCISRDHREEIAAVHQSGMGYGAISKQFGAHHSRVRKIVHQRKTCTTVARLPWSVH